MFTAENNIRPDIYDKSNCFKLRVRRGERYMNHTLRERGTWSHITVKPATVVQVDASELIALLCQDQLIIDSHILMNDRGRSNHDAGAKCKSYHPLHYY